MPKNEQFWIESLTLNCNTWNHLTVCKQMNTGLFKMLLTNYSVNGPGDMRSIPSRVIPKTQKMVLMTSCLSLSFIRYGSRVKGSNPWKGAALSPTPWCSSYQKGSLRDSRLWTSTLLIRFTIKNLQRLICSKHSSTNQSSIFFLYIYIYIYIHANTQRDILQHK